jgi:type II secretory pathway component PulF
MIRNLLIGLVTLVVAALLIGFVLPRTVEVSRSITINAPASEMVHISLR